MTPSLGQSMMKPAGLLASGQTENSCVHTTEYNLCASESQKSSKARVSFKEFCKLGHLISYSFSWTTELQALFVVFSILGSSLSGLCEYVFYIRICTANVLCLYHGAYMDSGNCCKEWMVLQMRTRREPPRNNPISGK